MQGDIEQLLRGHGLQVTAQRLAIMRGVSSRPHATADELIDDVRAVIGSISRQAVYGTLSVLVEKNLLRRIQPAGSAARYEDRVGDNHHHLICRGCGKTFDIDCALGAAPCLLADNDHGFEIDEAEVIFWGRCPSCQKAAAAGDTENEAVRSAPSSGSKRETRADAKQE
jgi:Fur family ferric uptake transcriptional regulator